MKLTQEQREAYLADTAMCPFGHSDKRVSRVDSGHEKKTVTWECLDCEGLWEQTYVVINEDTMNEECIVVETTIYILDNGDPDITIDHRPSPTPTKEDGKTKEAGSE